MLQRRTTWKKQILSAALALLMLLGSTPQPVLAAAGEVLSVSAVPLGAVTERATENPFAGKTLSILGDSISTYAGVSDISADVYMIPCYGQSLSVNTSAGPSTFQYTEPLAYDIHLNNNNVQDMCAGTAEAFRMMAEEYNVELPENFKIISCTGGTGGKSIQQLSKGSAYYNNVINAIKTAKANCDAAGLTMIVPCFTWTQGEEDMRAGGIADN